MKKLDNLIKAFKDLGVDISCDTQFDTEEKLTYIELNDVYDIEDNKVSFVYSEIFDSLVELDYKTDKYYPPKVLKQLYNLINEEED